MAAVDWETVTVPEGTFEHLFIREYARVVAIAFRVLQDADGAEDVAQDVFYQFYRQHRPDADYAAAWLHRAAAHAALNVIRGARRRRQREEREAQERGRVEGTVQTALDPQRAVEEAEQRAEVRRALSRLKPRSAEVLALRYSGLSYAEVAAALGVSVGQVGTLLRRAEEALRKELEHASR